MPTARFCGLIGVRERTRLALVPAARSRARGRAPARTGAREAVRALVLAHPAWGHRKVWAMVRHDGHRVSQATVLRLLREEGLLLEATYQRERRNLNERRKAAFATAPTGPNQVWQLDFSEFETTSGGTWRLAGCRDYWSKYEHRFHISPTANQHDAIAAVELALTEAAELAGRPLADLAQVDDQGNIKPVLTIVTDNGGPFRSFRFEAFIATHPELRHVRTAVKTPGQNGSRERGIGSLKYERLFLEEIPDAIDLAAHVEAYRLEYNTVRPHEALAWNRPRDVHLGHADPQILNFPEPQNPPST
jgi:transposase InsO family protein